MISTRLLGIEENKDVEGNDEGNDSTFCWSASSELTDAYMKIDVLELAIRILLLMMVTRHFRPFRKLSQDDELILKFIVATVIVVERDGTFVQRNALFFRLLPTIDLGHCAHAIVHISKRHNNPLGFCLHLDQLLQPLHLAR
ncbi:hypothetical protein PsorP6_005885 [Peronosclerospora sorghi]|uniref:Uncharacterized protein n=1 Tax=Peronosclerospora sorghi TaxID=230839 RepID=A0ACC0W7G4_9STRA|nr:hypothetical protein PsorP6_005885 [Peronosclerospora sorghi]